MSATPRDRLYTAAPGRLDFGLARVLKGFTVPAGCVAGPVTWKTKDFDGDIVHGAGCRWDVPLTADFEHLIPVGRGEAFMKALPDDETGELVTVPIVVTRFADTAADLRGLDMARRDGRPGLWTDRECMDCISDIREHVRKGAISGLSAEFTPLDYDEGRRNHATGRPMMDVREWHLHRYAHTRNPIQDNARLFEIEKAFRLAEMAKSPLVRKAFAAIVAAHPRAKLVPVSPPRSTKAMDLDPMDAAPPPADAPMDAPPMGDGTPAEITTIEDAAQAMADMAGQFRGTKTLDDKTRKLLGKWADALEKLGAEKAAHAESLRAKLDDAAPAASEGDEDGPADEDAEPKTGDEEMDEKLEKSFGSADRLLVAKAFRDRKNAIGLIVFKAGHTGRRRWKSTEAVDVPTVTAPHANPRPKVSVIADRIRARQAAAR